MGESSNGRLRTAWEVLAWILGVLLTAVATYQVTATNAAEQRASLNSRISVLESQNQQISNDIRDIKADIRALLREMRQP